MSRRLIYWTALALAAGLGYYAYTNPSFVDRCKSYFQYGSSHIQRLEDSSKNALKQTKLFTSVAKESRERAVVFEPVEQVKPTPAPPVPKPALFGSQTQRAKTLPQGERIARGRAFTLHSQEFGFKTEAEMAAHINRVIAHPSKSKRLLGDRTAYWDEGTLSVVILDPNAEDGGTAFKPARGKAYFDNLR